MTRINCIPPHELTTKHLISEYRELPRVRHAYPRKSTPKIPNSYRMGAGHVTFFFDKGLWLQARHRALIAEMRRRGHQVNLLPLDLGHWPEEAMNDWEVNEAAVAVSRRRIEERLSKVGQERLAKNSDL